MKGISYSSVDEHYGLSNLSKERKEIYERIWDESDYIITPSEKNVFFIMTNIVITPNQVREKCAEDYFELSSVICGYGNQIMLNTPQSITNTSLNECEEGRIINHKSHGRETGKCVKNDRDTLGDIHTCEINGWCPVELDILPMLKEPIVRGTENFTVFIKNSISVPWFGSGLYQRNNMPNGICLFNPSNQSTWLCPIFRIGDIVHLAGG